MGRNQPPKLTEPLCLWCSAIHEIPWKDRQAAIKVCPITGEDRHLLRPDTACPSLLVRYMFRCPRLGLVVRHRCALRGMVVNEKRCMDCPVALHTRAAMSDRPELGKNVYK